MEWQSLLDEVFIQLLELHFQDMRPFRELGKINVSLNFKEDNNIAKQLKENIIKSFSLNNYNERIKIINNTFSCLDYNDCNFVNIFKNVLIRNAFQHKKRQIDEDFLHKYGKRKVEILDSIGVKLILELNQDIYVYLPEIFELKKSIIYIINTWINYGKIQLRSNTSPPKNR